MKAPIVVCLMGPTASGKTRVAIELVRRLPFEIISVDSAMVYREMDIGTAKPSQQTLADAPHRLINLCDPKEPYSAGQFYQEASREIQKIHQQNRIPLLVGGTMLYFHVLQQGFSDLPSADKTLRNKIQQEADQKGWEALHQKLSHLDPEAARQIHSNDSQRIQRALEVYALTGQPLSAIQKIKQLPPMPYRFINIIIAPEKRELLHQRIADRFDQMLKNGFIEEVQQLYHRGDLNADLPAIRTVGYRQAWAYLKGKYDYDTMRLKAIAATRQLAKRQLTWLRRWKNATWFDSENPQVVEQIVSLLSMLFHDPAT